MKNFKKVLALVLVMAVVFSFTAMSASAFTDSAEITRNEAVDVMQAIGVINGYTDGSYKPTGDVTRAEMAKMITVLLNKGEDVGNLYKGAVTFADSTSHWAAGNIAYCAQEKIINGRNATTFDPDGKVTGTEAAKMLLCALGYDPTAEGLTGASWAANTLSLARKCESNWVKASDASVTATTKRAYDPSVAAHNTDLVTDNNFSLLNDMDSVSMTAPLNREDAAQMILNAMLCTKVSYKGSSQTINLGNGASFNLGTELQAKGESLYETYFNLDGAKKIIRTAGNGDAFGRPSNVWTKGGDKVSETFNKPTVTYKDVVTGGQVYTDLGKPSFTGAAAYTIAAVYEDGINITATTTLWTAARIASGNATELTKPGSVTEIFVDGQNITICVSNYYLAQISQIFAAENDANGDLLKEAYVTLKTVAGAGALPAGAMTFKDGTAVGATGAFFTEDYTTADRNTTYVVYTKAPDTSLTGGRIAANQVIQTLVKAEVKSGVAGGTSFKTDGTTKTAIDLDSTTYKIADKAANFNKPDYGSNATIYLDPNGNILYATTTSSDKVAYVLKAGFSTNAYNEPSVVAELLFTDGTTKEVTVYNKNSSGAYIITSAAAAALLKGTVKAYTINSNGEYELTVPTLVSVANGTQVKNKSADLGTTQVANNETTFIVQSTSTNGTTTTYSYTTYQGINAVPTMVYDSTSGSAALDIRAVNSQTATNIASYVFVIGGMADTTKANVSVFMRNTDIDSAASDANNNVYVNTKAVVDGQIVTAKVQKGTYDAYVVGTDTLLAYNKVSTDADGYVKGLTASSMTNVAKFASISDADGAYQSGAIALNGVKMWASGSYAATGTNKVYGASGSEPVFVFDTKNYKVTQTTIDAFAKGSLTYKDGIVVFDATELNAGNEVITAIYVCLG